MAVPVVVVSKHPVGANNTIIKVAVAAASFNNFLAPTEFIFNPSIQGILGG